MKGLSRLSTVLVIIILLFGLLLVGTSCKAAREPQEIKLIIEVKQDGSVETVEVGEETVVETSVIEESTEEESAIKDSNAIPEGVIPTYAESVNGVPEGTTISFDVSWDEISACTFGPGKYLNITFLGGEKVGSVFIMLGPSKKGNDKITYTLEELIPGAAWRGNSYYERLITKKDWMAWVDLKVAEMMQAPNASDSLGCNKVIVVVAQGKQILFQKTYEQ